MLTEQLHLRRRQNKYLQQSYTSVISGPCEAETPAQLPDVSHSSSLCRCLAFSNFVIVLNSHAD